MNPILESLYPDKTVLARRRLVGLAQLVPCNDAFVAYLHEEMRQCYLNGHDHAALVTACALIDFAVKDAIEFGLFVKADCVFDAGEWDKIDQLRFGEVLKLAKSRGVITKAEWKQLDWLRQHIRNVYMHGQTPDWIKDKDDTIIEGDLATGEAKEQTVSVRDNIVLQRHIRIVADRNVCDEIVRLVDGFVRLLGTRAITALEEWKLKNPSKPTVAQVERVLENMQKQGLQADLIITSDFPVDMPPPPEGSTHAAS